MKNISRFIISLASSCVLIGVNARIESVSLTKRQLLGGEIVLLEKAGGHYESGDPMIISRDDIGIYIYI